MITDSLSNCALYENVHKDLCKVFQVLQKNAMGEVTEKTVLDEGNVWINAPATVSIPEGHRVFEAHRDFIDVHYILSGSETFGYSNVDRLTTTREYDKEADYELLDGDKSLLVLKAGDFCIAFPQDAHIPFVQKHGTEKLVRVVAKVRV